MTDSERDQWRGGIDARMTRLEGDINGLNRETAILQADMGHMSDQLTGLAESVQTLATTVSEWRGGIATVKWLAGFAAVFSGVALTLVGVILERM